MQQMRVDIGSLKGASLGGFEYELSGQNLRKMVPFFLNDLEWQGNLSALDKIIGGIIDVVRLGEKWYNQAFGGWFPASNQFGIAPLRPMYFSSRGDNRWIWASSTTSTIAWSAEDTFVVSTTMATDEMILVYGYFNLEPVPNTLELYIQPGPNKLPRWNIETMRISGRKYFIFPEPFIIEPRSTFAIGASVRSKTTATYEEAGLLGYMIAPNARLLRRTNT
jgi:hypothetical protein